MSDTRADTTTPDTTDDDDAPDIAIYLDEAGLAIESHLSEAAQFDLLMEAAHAVGLATIIKAARRTN